MLNDLYFLLRYGLQRTDIENDWLFERCREVQSNPEGFLDLWAREHYKSTIITLGLTLQDILANPELTVGIFSHTRPIAKGFLRQIKRELESNEFLKDTFPDVLWRNPRKEAPKWSEDDGLVVKRKGNPKESTIEAWGLIDGQPTSKHFKLRVYDDIVTRESVTTPDMIRKTTEAWELSQSLGTVDGIARYAGTRYHYNDTYAEMLRRGSVKERIYTATVDGTVEGEPVLLPKDVLVKKRRDQGPYTFASQMLLNPIADDTQGFKYEWVRYYDTNVTGAGMNIYIVVDPANSKRKDNDYTAMWVIGLGTDKNYYILDIVRDRLNLTERTRTLFNLHRKWSPVNVGYERYGMQADIQHIEESMGRENYHFTITELAGKLSKLDRIRRLIPLFEQGKVWLPQSCFKTDYEGKTDDLVSIFVEQEYKPFPVPVHDDLLDALARITDEDMELTWPMAQQKRDRYAKTRRRTGGTAWGR